MRKTFIMIIMMLATTFVFGQETYKSEYNDIYGNPILYVAEKEQEEFPYSYSLEAGKFELGLNFGVDFIRFSGQDSVNISGLGKTLGLFGSSGFSFHPSKTGLSLNYAINNDIHAGIAFPLYYKASTSESSMSATFGSPTIFFDYRIIMESMDLHINPYVSVPFVELRTSENSGKTKDSNVNFKQPINFGLNILLTSPTNKSFLWDFLFGFYNQLEKTSDNLDENYPKFLLITAGFWAGSRLNDISVLKAGFVYTTTNLVADKVEAEKGVYQLDFLLNLMINKRNFLDFNFYYNIPLGAFENSTGAGFDMRYRLVF